MNRRCYVYVMGAGRAFQVDAAFDRVPVCGDHVLLFLSEEQRAKLGPKYGSARATPCIVKDAVLRPVQTGFDGYVADVFVSPVNLDDWSTKMHGFGRSDD